MSGDKHIEARLDRSLRKQVTAPTLGKSFDAAVWARIEEEASGVEPSATNPGPEPVRALRVSRWLAITNYVGVAATLAVALYFALGSFGGIEPPTVHLDMRVSLPAISDETQTRIVALLGQVLGFAALLFGLSFTSIGRRLRASFS